MAMTLPRGTVTYLFTDIEGSTRLLQRHGELWPAVLEDHHRLVREVIETTGGVEVSTEGDAFFVAFPSAVEAVDAVARMQQALARHEWPEGEPIRVRMGLHTGEAVVAGDNYVGIDVHRGARIASAAHGGQVLLSGATHALVAEALPPGSSFLDLGTHRLKDLENPEHLWQLCIDGLDRDFPPPRTLDARPNNLPASLTSFVGREREIGDLAELLHAARLVTLTGPGGTGKTRLSIATGEHCLPSFEDGVFFVGLSTIEDPTLVPSSITDALGVKEEGGRPVGEMLTEFLASRSIMLILDNFEQIVEAAPLVPELLTAAPRLEILVTSRGPLNVAGEHEYPVPPLEVPDPESLEAIEDVSTFAAISLFLERARAVKPNLRLQGEDLRVVAEICARLDGLPLAIELAAARVRLLGIKGVRDRLDRSLELLTGGGRDLPSRQRTLRGAIAWSFDLLDEPERRFFATLSVFVGGWDLEAAEAVWGEGKDLDVLTGVESLSEKGLIRREDAAGGEVRFRMLQTIREYGLEQLSGGSDAVDIAQRHAQHFAALAQTAQPHLTGRDSKSWQARLTAEHDNLRAALRWLIDHEEAQAAMETASHLWRFWMLGGHFAEGRRWLEDVMKLPSEEVDPAVKARAIDALGSISYWQNDFPSASACYAEALEAFRALGDRAGEAEELYNLGYIAAIEEDFDRSKSSFARARDLYEELGNEGGAAHSLNGLGLASSMAGELDAARAYSLEALDRHRAGADTWGEVFSLWLMGRITRQAQEWDEAEKWIHESIRIIREGYDVSTIESVVGDLADVEAARGNHERAAMLMGAVEASRERIGGGSPLPLVRFLEDPYEIAKRELGEDQAKAAWERGRSMSFEEIVEFALEGRWPEPERG